jgi:hypothetical protein
MKPIRRVLAWIVMWIGIFVGLLSYGLMCVADKISPDGEEFDLPQATF